jgi:hypothetical protein
MSCGKTYSLKSNQCCDMMRAKIQIQEAKLLKITIPSIDLYNKCIEDNKKEFVSLHFPDLVDTIMLR